MKNTDLSVKILLQKCWTEIMEKQDKFDEFISPDEGLFERNM